MWYAAIAIVSFLAGIGLGCLLAGDRRDRRAILDEDALSRRAEELMRQWQDEHCEICPHVTHGDDGEPR